MRSASTAHQDTRTTRPASTILRKGVIHIYQRDHLALGI